jgi:mono/diheme cytochrome c family protein
MAGGWGRRIGIGVAGIVTLVVIAALGVFGISVWRLGRSQAIPPQEISIPSDSASIERGHHLVTAITKCVDCHGEDLGGQVMDMGPLGKLTASNLTSGTGGVGPKNDAEWVRAIRHGVRSDGRPLVFMPSMVFAELNAADLGEIIAYVKSVPPVDHALPQTRLGPIGRLLTVIKPDRMLPATGIDHAAPIPTAIPVAMTPEYGKYLTVTGGCVYCHGDNLKGGIKEGPPGTPASADLTPAGPMASWSEADFVTTLRTGQRPDGTIINPFMPWRSTRLLTDEEIQAMWAYLRTL